MCLPDPERRFPPMEFAWMVASVLRDRGVPLGDVTVRRSVGDATLLVVGCVPRTYIDTMRRGDVTKDAAEMLAERSG